MVTNVKTKLSNKFMKIIVLKAKSNKELQSGRRQSHIVTAGLYIASNVITCMCVDTVLRISVSVQWTEIATGKAQNQSQ